MVGPWSLSLRVLTDPSLVSREKANLFVQGHEVEVVPGLNNLAIVDADDCDAGKLDGSLSRGPSH